jgi:pimeloyl-ACP methyl ester carboxylesterase
MSHLEKRGIHKRSTGASCRGSILAMCLLLLTAATVVWPQLTFANSTGIGESGSARKITSTTGSVAEGNIKNFVKADCIDFINERPSRVYCGFFTMPLNHDTQINSKPAGGDSVSSASGTSSITGGAVSANTVLIPVMVARSTRGVREARNAAVLIPGGGGPGAGMGFGYSYQPGEFLASYDSLRQAGIDVVIVDQRGAGFSRPRLTCSETLVAFKAMIGKVRTINEELAGYQTAISDCRNRLQQQHIDVAHFDTRQSAMDFLAIMRELDYPTWFTIATSYATTIAQAMVALQPSAFDRIVLDSPVPLHYQHPLTWERTKTAITNSIDRCVADDSCVKRYPNLAQKLEDILAIAAARPYLIKIRVYDDEGNIRIKTVVADDTTVLSILSTAVYYNEHISELPQVITGVHKGLPLSLNGFAETFWYQVTDDTYADGLNLTVHCKERQPLEESYMSANPGYHDQLSHASKLLLRSQLELCRIWRVAADADVIPRLQTDTSTLILAGGLDPVIGSEDIEHTAEYFTNVSVETMPGAGHSIWYQHECARDRVIDFLTSAADSATTSSAVNCDARVPGFK